MSKFIQRVLALFPSALPLGVTAFETWSKSIIDTYSLPDNDSTRFALATMILHADAGGYHKPKRYFARMVLKSMSNQIAGQVMQDLKKKQADEWAAAEAKQQAEDTAVTTVPSDETPQASAQA